MSGYNVLFGFGGFEHNQDSFLAWFYRIPVEWTTAKTFTEKLVWWVDELFVSEKKSHISVKTPKDIHLPAIKWLWVTPEGGGTQEAKRVAPRKVSMKIAGLTSKSNWFQSGLVFISKTSKFAIWLIRSWCKVRNVFSLKTSDDTGFFDVLGFPQGRPFSFLLERRWYIASALCMRDNMGVQQGGR